MDQNNEEKTKETVSDFEADNEGMATESRRDPDAVKKMIGKISEELKDKELLIDLNFIPEVQTCFEKVTMCYKNIMTLPLSEQNEFVRLLGNILVESNLLDACCKVIVLSYQSKWIDEKQNTIMRRYLPLTPLAMGIVGSISDASDEVAETAASHPNFLETLRKMLADDSEDHLKETLMPTEREEVLLKGLTIIHNVSMRDSNIGRLRVLEYTDALKPYLNSSNDEFRLIALASLAAIVNERESEIINTNQDHVKLLLEILQKGLASENHRHNGWSCKEIALIIRHLAQNDANIGLLVKLDALELLVKLGRTGDQEEQYESVQAIWALTFNNETKTKIANNDDIGVVEFLELKESETEDIKKACGGALWNLKEKVVEDTGPLHQRNKNNEKVVDTSSESSEDKGHVMISYQWDNKATLVKVRNSLEAAGIKVWMDIDQMWGSITQAMAEAVENANIVLVCMSRKYKNSPNCRAEADYAFKKHKKIIPLKLEHGYSPDGWLGLIVGTKLYFEFTDEYQFEQKFELLLREIQIQCGNDKEFKKPSDVTTTKTSKELMLELKAWNQTDLQTWIDKNDLKSSLVNTWTGSEVALLLKMSMDAPEFFYKFLHDNVRVTDLHTMSKVVWALDALKDGR